MPNVGGTEFPYTKAGIQKAKAWAEMTGKPLKMDKKYQEGGQAHRDKLFAHMKEQEGQGPTLQGAGFMGTPEEIANLAMGTVGGGPKLPKNLGSLMTRELKNFRGKLRELLDIGGSKKTIKDLNKIDREIYKREMQAGEGAYKRRELSQKERAAERYEGAYDISEYDDLIKQRKELGEHTGGRIMSADDSAEFFRDRAEGLKSWVRGQNIRARTRTPDMAQGGQIDPSSLEEVAHKPIEKGTRQAVRYKAKTKGGEQRHLTADISGLTNEEMKRQLHTQALREQIKANPEFADTVSAKDAEEFMNMKETGVWDLLKRMIPQFQEGGEVPQGRRMYGTNPRRKKYPMQTSTAGMPVRGETYKKGGKVKYHV